MFEIPLLLVLVPGVCLAATVCTAVLGPWVLGPRSHWPVVVALVIAAAASGVLLVRVHHEAQAAAATPPRRIQAVTSKS